MSDEIRLPNISGRNDAEKLQQISDYLYMLARQLRYSLNNLGQENFSEGVVEAIGKEIREPIAVLIQQADGRYARLSVDANEMKIKIADIDGKYSELKQTVDGFDFTGYVTFLDLSGSGKTEISGDNIKSGTIKAINISGCQITSEGDTWRMEMKNGGIGCYTGGLYVGGLSNADPSAILLIAQGGYDLWMKSGDAIKLEAPEIHLNGDVYINGNKIS